MCSWCIVTNLFLFQQLTHKKDYLNKTELTLATVLGFFHASVHTSVHNVLTHHLHWFGDIPVYSDKADISFYIKVLQTSAAGGNIVASFSAISVFLAKAATFKHVVVRSCTPLIMMPWWVHMVPRNLAGTRASTPRLELTIWWYSCHLDPSTPQQTHICWQHRKPFSWWETLQNSQITQSSVHPQLCSLRWFSGHLFEFWASVSLLDWQDHTFMSQPLTCPLFAFLFNIMPPK